MMKKFLLSLAVAITLLTVSTSFVEAKSIRVKSYTTKRGTYVNSYYRTSPNKIKYDNYSAKGNYNIYTGKKGTVNWW